MNMRGSSCTPAVTAALMQPGARAGAGTPVTGSIYIVQLLFQWTRWPAA